MSTTTTPPSGGGVHFAIPEGTASITQPHPATGEGHDSWRELGVNKEVVTSVTIPTSMASIGEFAFYGFSSLRSVAIPSSVTRIEMYAFLYCSSLPSVAIPTSVTSIAECAFFRCSSLASVGMPASVTSIETGAFYGCSALTSFAIPPSVTIIATTAFFGCSSLASIAIPASVASIEDGAFQNCRSLTSIAVPTSVTGIGVRAFMGCTSLASVTLTTSMASIGPNAFGGCISLATVRIQPGVDVTAGTATAVDDSNPSVWSKLFAPWDNGDYDEEDEEDEEQFEQLLPDDVKIWAPDTVVAQFTGQFKDCSRFVDIPRALRVAPDAKTWAGVQLWLWWLPPTAFSGDGDRVVCTSRQLTVWVTMLGGFRAEETSAVPRLPEELWLYMFGFLKHDQQPTFLDEGGGSEYDSEDDSEDDSENASNSDDGDSD